MTLTWLGSVKHSTKEFCKTGYTPTIDIKLCLHRYFRQLQEISDSVAEVTWESGLDLAIQAAKAEQNELEAKINTGRARHRYLDHLSKNKEDGTADEEDEACILCRCEFNRGFITQWYAFCL